MTNPFHSNKLLKSLSNYPISKGDVTGHDFHGNQYVSAGNQAGESQKLLDYVQGKAVRLVGHDAVAEHHQRIARANEETAKSLEGEKGKLGRIRDAYVKAGEAHREAAGRHLAAFVNPLTGSLQAKGAAEATEKAHAASLKADELNYGG